MPVFSENWLHNDINKNWDVMFENCYILGHLRLRLFISILLELQNFNSSTPMSSFIKSIDLKLYGLRVAVLEELIDLLNWKLYTSQTSILLSASSNTTSTLSSPLTKSLPSTKTPPYTTHCHLINRHHQIENQTLKHPPFGLKQEHAGTSLCENDEIIQSHFQSVQQMNHSIKLCLAFLPLECMNPAEQQEKQENHENSFLPEMGFHFEIIRYSFKRSLQLYFISSHLSMEFDILTNIRMDIHDDFSTTSNSMLTDHCSTHHISSISLSTFRFHLDALRLLNGWNNQTEYCLLDVRIHLIEVTEQLESSVCNLYINILHPFVFYTHESVEELRFYQKLITYCYLIGQWWRVFRRSIEPFTTTATTTTTTTTAAAPTKSDILSSSSVEYCSQNKYPKIFQYLGLSSHQLNARIHLAGISNNNNNNSTVGSNDTHPSGTPSKSFSFINNPEKKQLNQYSSHYDQILMERMKNKEIPQILCILFPHPDSPGLQFGLLNSVINLQCDFHDFNIESKLFAKKENK
ncbi:unnamed protein product [Trichobilharzia regenti]|nr:unnamed protein product [Trichobilharzia regenti]